jgi:uncharacterized membrane protein
MAFCPNCGSQVEGKFCAKCGSPVTGGTGPVPGPTPDPAPGPTPGGGATPVLSAPGLDENLASALCYLLWVVGGVLFLVLEPYNKNKTIRFHAFQAIFFWIAVLVIWICVGVVSTVFYTAHMGFIASLLRDVVSLGILVVWLLLMYKAYNRQKWVLPIVGPLAEKQA